ncbi:hypothetical protein NEDG_01880 [Nematocida displodere]|uniref:Elongation of fatty acids protein n=1 Tax=Nematocida displodere TaxID=1805483 RepID=A0A177EHC3_9MICR|nr:hypothetical protein NEDG_01880 [Nematocida displodere]
MSDKLLAQMKNISLHWEMPVFSSIAYVIWVINNNKRIKDLGRREKLHARTRVAGNNEKTLSLLKGKSAFLKSVMFLHNMGMAVFSMAVFVKTFSVVWGGFWSLPFSSFIEDPSGNLEKQLSYSIWIFYISKYYEIVDTAILFASGKESSFLQMYHHAGAIVACWLVSLSQTYCGWIWVVLNSFIHSLMYLYYAGTVLGIRPPFKRAITFMQIAQFFVGIIFGFLYISNPKSFSSDPTIKFYQYSAIVFNMVYVVILIALFLNFERRTYREKRIVKEAAEKLATPMPLAPSTLSSPITSPV